MKVDAVIRLLRKSCAEAGGQTSWGRANGVSTAYVSNVLLRRHVPGDKILRALDLERVVTYRRISAR